MIVNDFICQGQVFPVVAFGTTYFRFVTKLFIPLVGAGGGVARFSFPGNPADGKDIFSATEQVSKNRYWDIGDTILEQQNKQGWGAKIIDHLSRDLRKGFPETKGFSPRNLKYMRKFAEAYPDMAIVQQIVAQIPWGHNLRILDCIVNPKERIWYITQTIKNGWSRNVLVHQIESGLYHRQKGTKKITNFKRTLPSPQSDLAYQTIFP